MSARASYDQKRRPDEPSRAPVFLVTCEEQACLNPDDQHLQRALEDAAYVVRTVVWTDPGVDWSVAGACLVRSVWDYHLQPRRFRRWVETVAELTTLINGPELIIPNMHKRYLRQLAALGVPTVETVWISPGTRTCLDEVLAVAGWEQALVKPAVSASAWKTAKVRPGDPAGQQLVDEILQTTDVMVQPYLTRIEADGEVAVVAIRGDITHGAQRVSPLTGNILDTREGIACAIADDERHLAEQVLGVLPVTPEFARIDIVRDDNGHALLGELELIDPVLYLRYGPTAIDRLLELVSSHLS